MHYELFNPLKSSMKWEFLYSSCSEETTKAYRIGHVTIAGEPGFKLGLDGIAGALNHPLLFFLELQRIQLLHVFCLRADL